ncbi:glutamine synthetase/guanido kinase [Cladochytrium replicatum]|nr:glutamine synthetase/guanido kinase [Cladochytrium replicatum]
MSLSPEDKRVKVSGCDVDGIPRGKVIMREKFDSSTDDGFGFCNVIFGWDMHDRVYDVPVPISNPENGYGDILAKIDHSTFRRIPWENDIPFFLLDFIDPKTMEPLAMCPRSTLKRIVKAYADEFGLKPNCGFEYEFFNFKETPQTLADKQGHNLEPLTKGMFGYSVLRPTIHQDFFYDIYDQCHKFDVPVEGLHTETGPGVFEAAIRYGPAVTAADRAHLFKTSVKQLGLKHGVISSFMAKPWGELPGCSGHIHVSLASLATGANNFAVPGPLPPTGAEKVAALPPLMKSFLQGLLDGLPSVMPFFAPNINSYKRLVENYWAPITVSYGFENRTAAIRLIVPPTCSPSSARIEIRVPGADANPYFALAAILACGLRGIRNGLDLTTPPLEGDAVGAGLFPRLPSSLREATSVMAAEGSVAREALGDDLIDHYAATRVHEARLYERAVTSWELQRYIETV